MEPEGDAVDTGATLFQFNVSEPVKKENDSKSLAYWTYHVYTKTSLETFKQQEMVSVRRYSDFVWLREALIDAYPGVIVPPIPEKAIKGSIEKVVTLNATPLLEYRQRALLKFLVRTGAHPILCGSDLLREFIEMSAEEFQKRKEAPRKRTDSTIGQKFKEFSFSVGKSLGGVPPAAAPPPSTDGASATTSSSTPAGAPSDPWGEPRSYVHQLENSLVMLRERIELLVKLRKETSNSLNEFGKSFIKVGEIESSYEEGTLPKALIDVGHHSEHLSIVYREQADNETHQVIETISYYVGLTTAIRDIIKRLEKANLTRDTIYHQLVQLKEKQKSVEGVAGKEEQARKLELDIKNTESRMEEATQVVTSGESTFKEELKRFHREKQYDIKQMLKAFVDLQLEYSAKMKTSWNSVLPSVEAIKTD